MKPINALKVFFASIEQVGISLSQHQEKQIVAYYNLLLEWNNKINLVSRRETEELLRKHFPASMLYARFVAEHVLSPDAEIADFGSGGGLPGVMVSIVNSKNKVTLIDSHRKKSLFLNEVVKSLALRAEVLNIRVEDLSLAGNKKFDYGVARGLASLPQLIKLTKPLINEGGFVLSLKGKTFSDEFNPKEKTPENIMPVAVGDKWIKSFPDLINKVMLRLEF